MLLKGGQQTLNQYIKVNGHDYNENNPEPCPFENWIPLNKNDKQNVPVEKKPVEVCFV